MTQPRDMLEAILHLAGCQQRTAGYNDAISKKDIDVVDMEQMEATTLREVRAYVQTAERKALALASAEGETSSVKLGYST